MTRVRSREIETDAVPRRLIGKGAVGWDELDDRLKPGGAWWAGAIGRGMLGPGAVIGGTIDNGAVQAPNLEDASVTAPAIAPDSIDSPHLRDGSVTGPKVPEGALGARELADGSLTKNKFVSGTRPVEIVDGVPTDPLGNGFLPGDAVVDVSDDDVKIHRLTTDPSGWDRWDSSNDTWDAADDTWPEGVWTSAVDTGDLQGLISEGNFGDDLIVARMIAADQVGATEMAAIRMEVDKWIRSWNWDPGVAGWAIDGDGNAEFNDVTVRGNIKSSSVTAGQLVSSSYSSGFTGWALDSNGNAEFEDVTIRGGSVVGTGLVSSNYSTGSDGWALDENGNAEFNDATFRGNIEASSVTSGQLVSSNYSPGSSGWALDASGNVELNDATIRGNFQAVGGEVTVTGSGIRLARDASSAAAIRWGTGSLSSRPRILGDADDLLVRVPSGEFNVSATGGVRLSGGSSGVSAGNWLTVAQNISAGGRVEVGGQNSGYYIEEHFERPWLAFASGGSYRCGVGQDALAPQHNGSFDLGGSGLRWGTVYCGTLNESSDERTKTIDGRAPGLDLIGRLEPVAYHRKGVNRYQPAGKTRFGLTAQQVAAVLPPDEHDLVSVGEDGEPNGIAYTQMVGPLVASVQELAEQNRDLADRLAAVEAKHGPKAHK